MKTTIKPTLIETETVPGAYEMPVTTAIIDHAEHGRLLIQQGYGGESTLSGGAVRWRHGLVAKLRATDTLAGIRAEAWNAHETAWDALLNGDCGEGRELLDWSPELLAKQVGL